MGHQKGIKMKHSDQVVSFIETSINSAKLREGKRTEYRLKTTRGNVMEHLVLELLPPGGERRSSGGFGAFTMIIGKTANA
jgi:hypothetical protein